MSQPLEAIQNDLTSGDPDRIREALRKLRDALNRGTKLKLPLFGCEILDAFGKNVPIEMQRNLVIVVSRYSYFDPEPTIEERIAVMIGLVLRFAEGPTAFAVALELKISADPVRMVALAVREIERQGLHSPTNIKGAAYLASRLIDGREPVRRATLNAMREWPRDAPFCDVIEYIKPQLDDNEFALLI